MKLGGFFLRASHRHLIFLPFQETLLEGLSHPLMAATVHGFRDGEPAPLASALLWPELELLLHEQHKHGGLAQTFGTKLILQGFALETVVPQKVLKTNTALDIISN